MKVYMLHNIQKTENSEEKKKKKKEKKQSSVSTQSTSFTTRMPNQQMQQFLSDFNDRTPFAAPALANRSDAMIVCIAPTLTVATHLLLAS